MPAAAGGLSRALALRDARDAVRRGDGLAGAGAGGHSDEQVGKAGH